MSRSPAAPRIHRRPNRPARPWLGLYATEVGNRIAIAGVTGRGPAKAADVRAGDLVIAIAGYLYARYAKRAQ